MPPLTDEEAAKLQLLTPRWQIAEQNDVLRLQRVFSFANFTEALEFTNRIAAVAEQQEHHPLLITEWGRVTVQWWTHVINGLHRNDFVMAARTDELYRK
jgi:4a-hydroxytetrahydrobiopterin dehydratase